MVLYPEDSDVAGVVETDGLISRDTLHEVLWSVRDQINREFPQSRFFAFLNGPDFSYEFRRTRYVPEGQPPGQTIAEVYIGSHLFGLEPRVGKLMITYSLTGDELVKEVSKREALLALWFYRFLRQELEVKKSEVLESQD